MSFPRLADDVARPRSAVVRLVRLLVCLSVVAAGLVAIGPIPSAVAAAFPTPTNLPVAIEPFADYVPQTSCDPVAKPGTIRLANTLLSTYGAGSTYNTVYACGSDGGVSEHYDGRAIDWMNSIRNPAQAASAAAFLKFLFATDSRGNRDAMFRRLGIMYIVWNNHIWGSWNQRWDPYNDCASHPETGYDNSCHRNHMHISLTWAGARGITSYWTRYVTRTDWGPCVAPGLNWAQPWAAPSVTECPDHSRVYAPAGASGLLQSLTQYSGMRLAIGSTGSAVRAVQQAVGAPVDGTYGGVTRAAVVTYQQDSGVPPSGVMDVATWRTMMSEMNPQVKHAMIAGPPVNGQ